MLRSVLLALVAAASLLAFASLGDFPGGPLLRAGAAVSLGALATALAYGEATWVTIAGGALSALAFGWLERRSATGAAFAMCLLWLTPRFVLAETRRMLAILVVASIAAAGLAGAVFASYVQAPFAAHAASCVFAGACIALVSIVVPVQTAVACALDTAARAIDPPARLALERAARGHRHCRSLAMARPLRGRWRALVELADQRAFLQQAGGIDAERARKELDERIEACAAEVVPPLSDESTPSGTT